MDVLISFSNRTAPADPALALLNTETQEVRVPALPVGALLGSTITSVACNESYIFFASADEGGGSSIQVFDRQNFRMIGQFAAVAAGKITSLVAVEQRLLGICQETKNVIEIEAKGSWIGKSREVWRLKNAHLDASINQNNSICNDGSRILIAAAGNGNGVIVNLATGKVIADGFSNPTHLVAVNKDVFLCEHENIIRSLDGTRSLTLPGRITSVCACPDKLLVATLGESLSTVEIPLDSFAPAKNVDIGHLFNDGCDLLNVGDASDWPTVTDNAWREADELRKSIVRLKSDFLQRENRLESIVDDLLSSKSEAMDGIDAFKEKIYAENVHRIRQYLIEIVPERSTVLVISKGENNLLDLPGRIGWHFPRNENGEYPYYYPGDGTIAVAQLEWQRALGADYLFIPNAASWWLTHYPEFGHQLESQYQLVSSQNELGLLYSLAEKKAVASIRDQLNECQESLDHAMSVLDWNSGAELASDFPDFNVFSPPHLGDSLPYIDKSVDVVAVSADRPGLMHEARRIASMAVAIVRHTDAGWVADFELVNPDHAIRLPRAHLIVFGSIDNLAERRLASIVSSLPSRFNGEISIYAAGLTSIGADLLSAMSAADSPFKVVDDLKQALSRSNVEVVVVLNLEVVPLAGWLTPLLRVFADRPDAGVVSPKVIDPLGTSSSESDCLIQSDTICPACFAIRRNVIEAKGGGDYIINAATLGLRTFIQPESNVVATASALNVELDLNGKKCEEVFS